MLPDDHDDDDPALELFLADFCRLRRPSDHHENQAPLPNFWQTGVTSA